MATVTISIDDTLEERFRKEVAEHLGSGKGSLGRAVTEALSLWIENVSQAALSRELGELMESGYAMGRVKYKARGDLYDRG